MYTEKEAYELINEAVLQAQVHLRINDNTLSEILAIPETRVQNLRTFVGVITKKDHNNSLDRAVGFALLADTVLDVFGDFPGVPSLVFNTNVLKKFRNGSEFPQLIAEVEKHVIEDFLHTKRAIRTGRLCQEFMRNKLFLLEELEVDPTLIRLYPTIGVYTERAKQ